MSAAASGAAEIVVYAHTVSLDIPDYPILSSEEKQHRLASSAIEELQDVHQRAGTHARRVCSVHAYGNGVRQPQEWLLPCKDQLGLSCALKRSAPLVFSCAGGLAL